MPSAIVLLLQAATSPLLDNDPRDKYFYELIVYTGSSSGAGKCSLYLRVYEFSFKKLSLGVFIILFVIDGLT